METEMKGSWTFQTSKLCKTGLWFLLPYQKIYLLGPLDPKDEPFLPGVLRNQRETGNKESLTAKARYRISLFYFS